MASRRAFTYVLAASGGVVAATTAKHMVNDFLETMSMAVRGVAWRGAAVVLAACCIWATGSFR